VYFSHLRLVTSAEVYTLDSLLPSVAAASTNEKGSKRNVKAEPDKNEDIGDKRMQMLLDQYKAHLAGLPFLKAPCVLDLVAVLGAKNAALSSRLVKGLYEFRVPFAKEVNDTLKESVKVCHTNVTWFLQTSLLTAFSFIYTGSRTSSPICAYFEPQDAGEKGQRQQSQTGRE